jgi:RHS repeat-associated protein
VYDSQNRATDSYGPNVAGCFTAIPADTSTTNANGPTPTAACATSTPHTSTAYDGGMHGLNATWYNNPTLTGKPDAYSLSIPEASLADPEKDGAISHDWATGPPIAGFSLQWSAQYSGLITFPTAGTYTLYTYTDDATKVWLDDQLVINDWSGAATTHYTAGHVVTTTTANTVMRIRVAHARTAGTGHLELNWVTDSTPIPTIPTANVPVPGVNLAPAYNLATSTHVDDSAPNVPGLSNAQVPDGTTSATFANPWFGTPESSSVDPEGLNLTSTATYETPGTGYLRQLSSTKPAGAATTSTSTYYGVGQSYQTGLTADLVNAQPVCGVPLTTLQNGMTLSTTGPKPETGEATTTWFIYDDFGRIAATRSTGDTSWSCTTYDKRGRTTTVSFPAFAGTPARTISYGYTADGTATGDPLTTWLKDAAGTITTVSDLDGNLTRYTDVWGTETTATYDQTGRVISSTATPVGGTASVESYEYNVDSQPTITKENGKPIAVNTYSGGILTSIAYPSGEANAGNGTSLANIGYAPSGAQTSLTWQFADGQPGLTDTNTLSQSGRILANTLTDGTTAYNSTFSYDGAGRLTKATVPRNELTYSFAPNGCSANANAGADGNRTRFTDSTDGAEPTTVLYCYDNADRLTGDSIANAPTDADVLLSTPLNSTGTDPNLMYDAHGNITTLANQTLGYDHTNRHMSTKLADGTSIIYQRDATDRIVSMTTTDTDGIVTVTRYGFTGASDAPDYTYSNSTQAPETFAVSEHTIGLPGGVSVSIQAEQQVWSYPNIQGGIAVTTDSTGTRTGTLAIYDPFGNPINLDTGTIGTTDADTAVPDNTTTPGNSYGWQGSHQKAYQHTAGITTIEMGARQYVPLLGRFLSTDPIAGGNDNTYNYPNDSINSQDLTGKFAWGEVLDDSAGILGVAALFGCGICAAVSAGISLGRGIYKLSHGDKDGWWDIAGAATFGVGKALKIGVRVWRAKKLADTPKWVRGKTNAAKRVAIKRQASSFRRNVIAPYATVERVYGIVATVRFGYGWNQRRAL